MIKTKHNTTINAFADGLSDGGAKCAIWGVACCIVGAILKIIFPKDD